MTLYAAERFADALFGPIADRRASLVCLEGEDALAFAIECVLEPVRARDPATRANETLMHTVLDDSRSRGDVFALAMGADGARVGFVWTSANGPPAHTEIYLNELTLVGAARGAGLGTSLLARLEFAARAAGARAINLDFMADNVRVLSLYVRAGYAQVGVDLVGPREGLRVPGLDVSPPRQDELHALIESASARGALRTFVRPSVSAFDVEREISAASHAGTIVVARRGAEIGGMAMWRLVPSIAFGDVVCSVEVLDGAPDAVPALVDGVSALVPQGACARIAVTVREPSGQTVAALAERGLRILRRKLAKRLDPSA